MGIIEWLDSALQDARYELRLRRRCSRLADFGIERREPDARASHRTLPRDCHPAEHRSGTRPISASVHDREPLAFLRRRRPRDGVGRLGSRGAAVAGPPDLPRLSELGVDTRVLAFTLLASLASALLFGLAPALSASNVALGDGLKEGGRGDESRKQGRARGLLVVAQVTFSVLLLIGAGLLIRSFSLLGQVNPGFQAAPDHLLTMFISPTGPRFDQRGVALAAYWVQLLDRVRALPGVESASSRIPCHRTAGLLVTDTRLRASHCRLVRYAHRSRFFSSAMTISRRLASRCSTAVGSTTRTQRPRRPSRSSATPWSAGTFLAKIRPATVSSKARHPTWKSSAW